MEHTHIEIITDNLIGSKKGEVLRIVKEQPVCIYYLTKDNWLYGIPKSWENDIFRYVEK